MALEPLETRYTGQWYHGIPNLLKRSAVTYDRDIVVHNVAGDQTSTATTVGAFLYFAATNICKNSQFNKVAEWFQMGKVKA
ncbi:hypothetical protein, partial [Escherichia coli]|uniref:hypothetical protein n=1 Tax=Escherichia coli TaxID=562 RepID=UPI001965D24E